ncbi:MAG: outer membrane beta-barrel protein [Opitutaceae bacterium]
MKTNKSLILSSSFAFAGVLAAPFTSWASPLVSVGDNVDIFFNGKTSVTSDTNIFRAEGGEVDDLVWTVSPGFDINFGRGQSNAAFSVSTRYDIVRYQDQSQLDTELFNIEATGAYQTGRLEVSGVVGYNEVKSSTGDSSVDELIEWNDTKARLVGEYRYSPKLSAGVGVDYTKREYTGVFGDWFADRESVAIPLDLYYELSPKVDLSVGYTPSTVDVDKALLLGVVPVGDYETTNHFFNVGVRGELLPKLQGAFKVGYRDRSVDGNGEDTSMLGLDSQLTWTATPKITNQLLLSRDFGVGSEGSTTEVTSVKLYSNYSIGDNWALTANAGYTLRDYDQSGREDDQYQLGAGLTYVYNSHLRFSVGYNYVENSSSQDIFSYESHQLSISAGLRY